MSWRGSRRLWSEDAEVFGVPEVTFEKGEATRTIVIEFPSVEAAVAAHDSEAYQEALRALDGGADRDMRVVPGA